MSTNPLGNAWKVAPTFILGAAPQLVGGGVEGAPLAKRVMWNGKYRDDGTGLLGVSISNEEDGDYYPLDAGIKETLLLGPGAQAQIWAKATAENTPFYVYEVISQ